jgi:hypothetical protein
VGNLYYSLRPTDNTVRMRIVENGTANGLS